MRNRPESPVAGRVPSVLAITLALLGAACDSRSPPVEQKPPPVAPTPTVRPAVPAPSAAAQSAWVDVPRLFAMGHCDACHAATEPLLGPSYEDIARTYASRRDAMLDVLARKIISGGGGNWGVVPMVPCEQFTTEEARAMAEWILDSLRDRGADA